MMKKCYIAGKIGDTHESVYKAKFEQAKQEVRDMGFEPISPVDLPHAHDKTWTSYMKEDLTIMLQCDCVYALRDWRHSPGAKIEIRTATDVGIAVYHQSHLTEKEPYEESLIELRKYQH